MDCGRRQSGSVWLRQRARALQTGVSVVGGVGIVEGMASPYDGRGLGLVAESGNLRRSPTTFSHFAAKNDRSPDTQYHSDMPISLA